MAQFNPTKEDTPPIKVQLQSKTTAATPVTNPDHHKINNHFSADADTHMHVRFENDKATQSSSELERRHTTNTARKKTKRLEKERKKWKKKMAEIGRNHPEFELSYDLLLGIRTSTSLVNSSVMRSSAFPESSDSSDMDDDLDKEFQDSKRYSFPSSGSSCTPPHHMNDFEFKDYCRPIFAQLREWFGVSASNYLVKLCGGFNLLEFISNSKSGQFFFYSHDGQFLIKSMTRSECKLMRQILAQYYHHVKNQPNTLLTKFYGMYRVKTHNRQAIYFIVMGSVFYTDLEIHKIYDLKGSTHGRKATVLEKSAETPVLKDLDFLENMEFLKLGKLKAKLYKEQIRRDTELLRRLGIMDYSVLLGIHYTNHQNSQNTPITPPNQLLPSFEANVNISSTHSDPGHSTAAASSHPHHSDDDGGGDGDKNNDHDSEKEDPYSDAKSQQNEDKYADKYAFNISKIEINPKPSTTALSQTPDLSDISENGGGGGAVVTHSGHRSVLSVPMLNKVNSRRLSQIGMKHAFTVKTPIGQNFDMPELIDVVAMKRNLEMKSNEMLSVDEDDENVNIFCRDNGGMKFEDEEGNKGDVIYFTGIIDILQKYNKRKKVEHFFRGINTDTDTISAVPPDQYARRMYEFMKDKIV